MFAFFSLLSAGDPKAWQLASSMMSVLVLFLVAVCILITTVQSMLFHRRIRRESKELQRSAEESRLKYEEALSNARDAMLAEQREQKPRSLQ